MKVQNVECCEKKAGCCEIIREKRFTEGSRKLSKKVITYFHEEVGAGVQDGGTSFCRGPKVGKSIV